MANATPWIFLQNPMLHSTENSYRNAAKISEFHFGALQSQAGNPFFDGLITAYSPLHSGFMTAYQDWKNSFGQQQSKTLTLTQLLSLLRNTKIRNWDVAIQNVYAINTAQYKALLPSRRVPFQNGNQTDRVSAVKTLSLAIGSDASLATVKTDVDAFYTQLNTALTAQKGGLAGKLTGSDAVEAARVAMCTGQYANLGALIQHFAATPDNIGQYFDLLAIRDGAQVIFTGDTNPGQTETIVKHTFNSSGSVRLQNTGTVDLKFFLSATQDGPSGALTVIVSAGTETTVAITALGDITNTYLNVFNASGLAKGEWTIELE